MWGSLPGSAHTTRAFLTPFRGSCGLQTNFDGLPERWRSTGNGLMWLFSNTERRAATYRRKSPRGRMPRRPVAECEGPSATAGWAEGESAILRQGGTEARSCSLCCIYGMTRDGRTRCSVGAVVSAHVSAESRWHCGGNKVLMVARVALPANGRRPWELPNGCSGPNAPSLQSRYSPTTEVLKSCESRPKSRRT